MYSPRIYSLKDNKGKARTKDERERLNKEIKEGKILYIGRRINMGGWNLSDSKWANPYKLSNDDLNNVLIKYEEHVRKSRLYEKLDELNNKDMYCWCKTDKNKNTECCHGDVLIRLFNEKYNF